MTKDQQIELAKRYIEDLLQEIPDKINAYEWEDQRLAVYSGREKREIEFSLEDQDREEWQRKLEKKIKDWIGA